MSLSPNSATSKGTPAIEDIYPLSPLQQGILFHCVYAPKSVAYFMQVSWTFHGAIEVEAFRQAWQQLVDRHAILRTRFVWDRRDQPLQVVMREVELPWEYLDWQDLPDTVQQDRLEDYLIADRERSFDLGRAPLMRVALIRLNATTHQFIWSHHHLLLDGWCLPLILQEFLALYEAACVNRRPTLAPPRAYRDYIVWLQQQDQARAETFWREYLSGFTTPTPLAIDRAPGRPPEENPRYDQQQIQLDAATTAALQTLARQHQLTLNALVQGAWALLLSRYSGARDVIFGITVAGRPADIQGVESIVGLFINTLPLRARLAPGDTLIPWLKQLQAQQIDARQYDYSALVQIQGWSNVPRGTPLFESLLVFQNYPSDTKAWDQQQQRLAITGIRTLERTNYPLTLVAQPDRELRLTLVYDCDRFDDASIGRMLDHLRVALTGMVADPAQRLADLPFLTEAERQELAEVRNSTTVAYPATVYHELVEAQAARTPNAIAAEFGEQRLTYRELDQRANQLAHDLRRRGAGPGVCVGLCMERSLDMLVALLGIFKAGSAFLPLDPGFPHERMAFMLQDTQAGLLLTQAHLRPRLAALPVSLVALDEEWDAIATCPADAPPAGRVTGAHLAYVIYTSGSTGRPKGVMIPHSGLVNYLIWCAEAYGAAHGCGAPVQSSIAADAIFPSLFAPLIVGTTVILLPGSEAFEGLEALSAALQQPRSFSMIKITPTQLDAINQYLPRTNLNGWVRTLVVGAEALRGDILHFWQTYGPETIFLNEYGPTETVVGCSIYQIPPGTQLSGAVPIGLPIANTQYYVLDSGMRLVPIGIPGELYIGGDGVAWGYQNRPDLTAAAFVPDPFSGVAGARLYKTGDLMRYLPDRAADIEFLGRIDDQVKIRGYRVELGEIEAVLIEHPAVREVAVLARQQAPGQKRLVAYVVPMEPATATGTATLSAADLRSFLKERVPDYMVPEAFVFLEALPLTPHGKLNRQALPDSEEARPESAAFVAPRNLIEQVMADTWAKVLQVERVGIHDNFFALGGHSLLVMRVVARVREHLRLDLPLRAIFEAPTIELLVASLPRYETTPGQIQRIEQLLKQIAGMSGQQVRESLQQTNGPRPAERE